MYQAFLVWNKQKAGLGPAPLCPLVATDRYMFAQPAAATIRTSNMVMLV